MHACIQFASLVSCGYMLCIYDMTLRCLRNLWALSSLMEFCILVFFKFFIMFIYFCGVGMCRYHEIGVEVRGQPRALFLFLHLDPEEQTQAVSPSSVCLTLSSPWPSLLKVLFLKSCIRAFICVCVGECMLMA